MLLERTNHRTLPPDYAGDVFVWDIDKTYLETRFSSVRGLLGIVAEAALDKRAVPGAVALIRALRRGPGAEPLLAPLYFVSGSPPQLRGILERKMLLDGVQHDGITFKDQFGYLRALRPKAIREQVGYKTCALLLYRRDIPGPSRWWLFGDDVESDAAVFTLFGEICAGLRGDALRQRMLTMGAQAPEVDEALRIADRLPQTPDPVARVFIRLERGRDPLAFGHPKVCPVHGFLQAALVLAQEGRIRPADVTTVAESLRAAYVPEAVVTQQAEDAVKRLGVDAALLERVRR